MALQYIHFNLDLSITEPSFQSYSHESSRTLYTPQNLLKSFPCIILLFELMITCEQNYRNVIHVAIVTGYSQTWQVCVIFNVII